jgi:hypothetical protein
MLNMFVRRTDDTTRLENYDALILYSVGMEKE